MSYVERLNRNRGTDGLYLVRGKDSTGHAAWYYFRVKPSRKIIFDRMIKAGQVQLTEFGDIITSGYGEHPPPEVKKRMKDEYGFQE